MAEGTNAPAGAGNINNQTPPTGTDPTKTEKGDQGNGFDPSKLSDADIGKIYDDPRLYKHDRFKELAAAKQQLKKFEAEQAKAEEDRLVKQKEFETLAEKRKAEADALRQQIKDRDINDTIREAARKAGAVDLNAVIKLIDRSGINIDDSGIVSGADDAVKKLLESSPYLKGSGNGAPSVGSPSNPGDNNSTARRFKASQLRDHAFFKANEADIMKASKLGLIEDDISG